jgi:formiminoglutamate deiminase
MVAKRAFLAELAWLGREGGVAHDVLIEVDDGRITSVATGVAKARAGTKRLKGVTVPGFVNAHSHAFHRALRGRSQMRTGDFWTWREMMYELAQRLDPESYLELATAVYAEMALAGITAVGEFHYLHHGDAGKPYNDPNEMGLALAEAAERAGIRITLLDTCFLRGGLDDQPLMGTQLRFGDGTGERWSWRVDKLLASLEAAGDHVRPGVAIHSVRAVAPPAMQTVATYAARHELPLHFHLSEQQRENADCLAEEGCTPTVLLERAGALTDHTTAVHAIHLHPHDMTLLGLSGTSVCACPTTERDLADGVGQFGDLRDAGSALCIGTDSHAVVDPFEEMRAVELDERLMTQMRGIHQPVDLLHAATAGGAGAIGWPEAGRIETGALADFVTISLESPRLAATVLSAGPEATGGAAGNTLAGRGLLDVFGGDLGRFGPPPMDSPSTEEAAALEAALVFAASAADVRYVVVGGRTVVDDGRHALVDDVPGALRKAVERVLSSR